MLKVKHELYEILVCFRFVTIKILFDLPFRMVLCRIIVRTSEPFHIIEIIIAEVRRTIQTIKILSTQCI